MPIKHLVKPGDVFSLLTVLSEPFPVYVDSQRCNLRHVDCRCECGNYKTIKVVTLLSKRPIKSCGCEVSRGARKHRGSLFSVKHPLYAVWRGMRNRCKFEVNYAGRGILVCREWEEFSRFALDMGDRPSGTSLDRIDNNDGYFKENCRWATKEQQARNTRANHFLSYKGEVKTVSEWASVLNINPITLFARVTRHQWSVEKSLTTPVRVTKNPWTGKKKRDRNYVEVYQREKERRRLARLQLKTERSIA